MTYRTWLLAAAAVSACLAAPAAFAADAAPASGGGDAAPAPATSPATSSSEQPSNVQEVVVTGRFLSPAALSATRLNISVQDTPVSVSSYTRAFMDAIRVVDVADLYRYMTGVQRAGNTGYDLTLRGFKTSGNDRNAILVDGLPGLAVRFGSPPTIGAASVEVVKGPTSVLYGQAQPGGFVNIITKKPSATPETELELSTDKGFGHFDRDVGVIGSIDSTGPLNSSNTLLYRFIAETGYSQGFRIDSSERPIYIAPSLTWKLTPDTEATLQVEYRRTRTHYDTYLATPHKDIAFVPAIDTVYQEPTDYLLEEGETTTLFVKHDFNDHWRLNFDYRYVNHDDSQKNFDVVAVANNFTQVTMRARGQHNHRTYSFGDLNLTGDFNLGPIHNQTIFGLDLGEETADLDRLQFFNLPAQYNRSIYNPVLGTLPALTSFPLVNPATPQNLNDRYSIDDAVGAYASDLISFTSQLKLLLGIRYAKDSLSIIDKKILTVPHQRASNSDWLPMAGLIYEPVPDLSIYTSYSTSFVPTPASNIDINGLYTFKPTTAWSVEGGAKANLFDHRLSFTLAVFDIHKQNVVNSFTCTLGTCSDQIGGEESRGVEVEADANPLPNWQISLGYSYDAAKVVKSDVVQAVGARLTNVPWNNAHLWTRYDFDEGNLKGLGLGLGIAYVGDRTGLLPTATSSALLVLPAYTTVDAALYYRVNDRWDFTLKVSNLLDATYYESAGFTADINVLPGQPRTLTLTARTRF
jgi:iron complex outermembrane receptor protein